MRIEIKERGSEEFYRETVIVASQYQNLMKNPQRKLKNPFKSYRTGLILCSVLFLLLGVLIVLWGIDTTVVVALVVLAVNIILSIILLRNLNKLKNTLMNDTRTSVFNMDERGVELDKEGAHVVRIAWDNLAFIRVFDKSICFAAKEGTGLTISIDRKYEDEIRGYMKENKPDYPIL